MRSAARANAIVRTPAPGPELTIVVPTLNDYLDCAASAVANVGIASFIFSISRTWWIAGLAGAFVSAVWNYAATSFLTWKRSR